MGKLVCTRKLFEREREINGEGRMEGWGMGGWGDVKKEKANEKMKKRTCLLCETDPANHPTDHSSEASTGGMGLFAQVCGEDATKDTGLLTPSLVYWFISLCCVCLGNKNGSVLVTERQRKKNDHPSRRKGRKGSRKRE